MSCNVNFETEIENFLDELEAIGGFDKNNFKNSYSQIFQLNADSIHFFLKIIDNLKETFDQNEWKDAFIIIIQKSISVFCDEEKIYFGGVNAIIQLTQ